MYGIILGLYLLLFLPYREEEYFWFLKIRDVNFWIVLLVIILYLIILRIETGLKFSINFMFVILLFTILVNNLIRFFLIYEIVFILIIFTIVVLGYRFERLIAGFIMIFYSFLFSSPTLIILLVFDYRFLIKSWLVYSFFINFFFVGSFIVKFPIFGFHYWLPVAHVEASTVGRIVLAGILLKLGSIGLFYLINYINFIIKFHWLTLAVPIIMLITLIIRDLKIIIAYSSVAHMSIVFYILMLGAWVGKKGALLIIFYHGFISPLIFWVVGILAWWKTRSLIVVKFIVFSYLFILVLFILLIINIGFPPFIGFLREIFILKSIITVKLAFIGIILGVLFRCYYNIYLFWCFRNSIGIIFKLNFYSLDLFIFILFSFLLTLY